MTCVLLVCNDICQLAHQVYVQLPALLEPRHKNRNRRVINMRQSPGRDCTRKGRQSRTTTAGGRSHLHLRKLERGARGVDAGGREYENCVTRLQTVQTGRREERFFRPRPSSGLPSNHRSNHRSLLLNLGVLFFGSGWNLTCLATLLTPFLRGGSAT
jgi:hypothetical protein